MSRYTNTFYTNLTFEEFNTIVSQYLTAQGFKQINPNYDQLWKKGVGLLTAPMYIGALYNPQNFSVTICAYIKFALLPGVYIGEMDLTGFFGAVPKSMLKTKVAELEQMLNQTAYNKQIYMQQQQQNYQQPVQQGYQQNFNNYNN